MEHVGKCGYELFDPLYMFSISGSVRLLKRVTAEVSTRIITKKTNLPTDDTLNVIGGDEPSENTRFKNRLAVQRSVAHRETLKHAVHQHCRSSIPGQLSCIIGLVPSITNLQLATCGIIILC